MLFAATSTLATSLLAAPPTPRHFDDGKAEPLVLGEDAFFSTRVDLAAEEITVPLVFAGSGLRVPEKGFDDFAGLDLKGKVAVFLAGSPAEIPGPLASHYQTARRALEGPQRGHFGFACWEEGIALWGPDVLDFLAQAGAPATSSATSRP